MIESSIFRFRFIFLFPKTKRILIFCSLPHAFPLAWPSFFYSSVLSACVRVCVCALCSTNKHTSTRSAELALIPKCYPIIFLCCSSFAFDCYLFSLSPFLSQRSFPSVVHYFYYNGTLCRCFALGSRPFHSSSTHTQPETERETVTESVDVHVNRTYIFGSYWIDVVHCKPMLTLPSECVAHTYFTMWRCSPLFVRFKTVPSTNNNNNKSQCFITIDLKAKKRSEEREREQQQQRQRSVLNAVQQDNFIQWIHIYGSSDDVDDQANFMNFLHFLLPWIRCTYTPRVSSSFQFKPLFFVSILF